MLLVVTLCPFVCALILFAYFFGRFAGEQDTAKLADAMRQMHYARVIPFPGLEAGKAEPADLFQFQSRIDARRVATAAMGEVLLFTESKSNENRGQGRQKARGIAKGTSA